MISMQGKPTVKTGMPAVFESLGNFVPAAATFLACSLGIDFYILGADFDSFAPEYSQEPAPASILDRPTQPAVLEHPPDVQAFHRDESEATNEFQSDLMVMLAPLVSNAGMKSLDSLDRFPSVLSSLLLSGDVSLSTTKFWKFFFQVPRVGFVFAFRSRQEGLESDIDSNGRFSVGFDLGGRKLAGEDRVPVARFPFQGDGLRLSFDLSVKFDLNRSNILDTELVTDKLDPVPVGRKLNRVEVVASFEARIARFFLGPFFDSAEELLEGLFETPHRRLGAGMINPLVVVV